MPDAEKLVLNLVLLVTLLGLAVTMAGPAASWVRREMEWFRVTMVELYMPGVSPQAMMAAGVLCAITGAMMGHLLMRSMFAAVPAGVLAYALPRLYLMAVRNTRRKRLNQQLVDGILTISNGVASGLNLPASLKLVEQNAPAPLCQEIGHLLKEYEFGMPLETAMERAADRVELPNYRLLFLALRTGMERGGRLAETLKGIAESLREISRLEDKVETMTAQGRSSARMMSAMPLVVVGILYLIDPEAIQMLFTTGTGRVLLTVVGVILVGGWLWMRKIVSVDV
jgi:tight adherence protein B